MKEKPESQSSERLGVSDFLKFMYDGQPEWSLVAVKAPIEEVAEEFADHHGATTISKDVPRKPAGEYDDVETIVAIVQVKGNPWTIIFRSVLYVNESNVEGVTEDAKELSGRLATAAVTFVGEDTSGANAFKHFEKGKLVEDFEWESGGDFYRFKSSLRKRPTAESVEDDFIDGVFKELGIYLPACFPMSEKGNVWLAVEKDSLPAVERADLIDLPAEEEEEDEDEEEDAE
jgi:hypothetical protein